MCIGLNGTEERRGLGYNVAFDTSSSSLESSLKQIMSTRPLFSRIADATGIARQLRTYNYYMGRLTGSLDFMPSDAACPPSSSAAIVMLLPFERSMLDSVLELPSVRRLCRDRIGSVFSGTPLRPVPSLSMPCCSSFVRRRFRYS